MIKNILNIVGWLGTALVVAAVAVRFVRPEWDQYAIYGAWAGLACVVLGNVLDLTLCSAGSSTQ